MKWMRLRFETNKEDFRPIKWPPPGPYWCSGYLCDIDGYQNAIIVAFIPLDPSTKDDDRISFAENIVREFWPEANNIETSGTQWRDIIEFYDRFPCPNWWDEKTYIVIGPTYE